MWLGNGKLSLKSSPWDSTFYILKYHISIYWVSTMCQASCWGVWFIILFNCPHVPLQAKPLTHIQIATSKVSNIFKSVPGQSAAFSTGNGCLAYCFKGQAHHKLNKWVLYSGVAGRNGCPGHLRPMLCQALGMYSLTPQKSPWGKGY